MSRNILRMQLPAGIDLSNHSKLPVQFQIEQLAVRLDCAARDLIFVLTNKI